MPDAVTKRVQASYEATLNADDHVMSAEKSSAARQGQRDALLVTPVDKITPDLVGALPASIKMIATFSVGYEHINIDACKQRGLPVSTPRTC